MNTLLVWTRPKHKAKASSYNKISRIITYKTNNKGLTNAIQSTIPKIITNIKRKSRNP